MRLPDKCGIYRFPASALCITNIGNKPSFPQIYTVLPPKPVMLQNLVLWDRRRVRKEKSLVAFMKSLDSR